MDNLEGSWTCVRGEKDGEPLPADVVARLRLVLTPAGYRTILGEQVLFEGTYWLNSSATPKEIDILAPDGGRAPGIYELAGDTHRICYVMAGERPKTFACPPGVPSFLIVWKREKVTR